ncbi:MAG: hypothetical protein R3A79_28725 [Nannocystaceae bacterium]
MKRPSLYRPSAAYAGLVTFTLGAVLWMVSERPEWRASPGEEASATGQVLASVGQGGAAVGGSLLAYRALQLVRERDAVAGEEAPRALVDRGADLPPQVQVDLAVRVRHADARAVEALLRGALTHRSLAPRPAPEVRQGADGRFHITAWLEPDMFTREVRSDLNTQLFRALREAGLDPLPDDDRDAPA